MYFLQTNDSPEWMAPYAYAIVFLGFLFFLFRVFENFYGEYFNRPLVRHYFTYRKLSRPQQLILDKNFPFYKKLSRKHRRQFVHRVATFIKDKEFVGREDLVVTDQMKVLIAAVGCMLSFGRKNYTYGIIHFILIYPGDFYSNINKAYHKGEINPRGRALVLSWAAFLEGIKDDNDNLNLGIHEFMHAMQLEAKRGGDPDSTRFEIQFQNILKRLTDEEIKERLNKTAFFREYAFTNQFEFMAVLAEYFIESPAAFKSHFPELYESTKKMLNFRFSGY
jgi:Mlc titration factor MtfA (ptsG expression regulator)